MPEKLHILFYEYVDDLLERRAPHREGHLALIKRWHDEGRIGMAGALGNPPHAMPIRPSSCQRLMSARCPSRCGARRSSRSSTYS